MTYSFITNINIMVRLESSSWATLRTSRGWHPIISTQSIIITLNANDDQVSKTTPVVESAVRMMSMSQSFVSYCYRCPGGAANGTGSWITMGAACSVGALGEA